jgi:predicted nucleotidyltransferase
LNSKLERLPRIKTLQDYRVALDRYLKRVVRIEEVKTVCLRGSFASADAREFVPGISDIDLVVDVDEKISHHKISKLSIDKQFGDDKEILIHNPIVITEQTSSVVFEFPAEELVCVYGESGGLGFKEVRSNTFQTWATILELVPQHIFWIDKLLAQNKVNLLLEIRTARSVRHLIEYYSDLRTLSQEEWKDYDDSVNFLSDSWLKLPYRKLAMILESVLQKAWKIVTDIAWDLDAELTTTNQFAIGRETQIPIGLTYFLNERAIVKKEKPKEWNNIQHSNLFYPLPPSCFQMLDVYQTTGGLLAKFLNGLSSHRWSGLQPSTEFELYLAKRAEICNRQVEFLSRKNICFGHFASPFVFNPFALKNRSALIRTNNTIWMLLWDLKASIDSKLPRRIQLSS